MQRWLWAGEQERVRGRAVGGWAGVGFSGQGLEWDQPPPCGPDHEASSFSLVSLGGAPRMLTRLERSLNPRPWGGRGPGSTFQVWHPGFALFSPLLGPDCLCPSAVLVPSPNQEADSPLQTLVHSLTWTWVPLSPRQWTPEGPKQAYDPQEPEE